MAHLVSEIISSLFWKCNVQISFSNIQYAEEEGGGSVEVGESGKQEEEIGGYIEGPKATILVR